MRRSNQMSLLVSKQKWCEVQSHALPRSRRKSALARRLVYATAAWVLLGVYSGREVQANRLYGASGLGHCRWTNHKLASFLEAALLPGMEPLIPQSTSYDEFLLEIKNTLDKHMLPDRAIHHIFSDTAYFHPFCDGDWMEFGVAYASTINLAAQWRANNCGHCSHVHGFDTFTGLPENWKRDDGAQYPEGTFDMEGNFPAVLPNVNLVKGLFNESLPGFLHTQMVYGAGDSPLTFLHIDCDLYRGAADAFIFLSHKIVPGTVIVFDDLVNYQYWREGEVLALWQWLAATGAKLATIGMLGPLPGRNYAVEFAPVGAEEWFAQSAAFVVISFPGRTNPFDHSKELRRL